MIKYKILYILQQQKRKLVLQSWKSPNFMGAKRVKSDNFTRINREMSILLSQYWKNECLDGTIIISYFGGSNNILADCIWCWVHVHDRILVYYFHLAFKLS